MASPHHRPRTPDDALQVHLPYARLAYRGMSAPHKISGGDFARRLVISIIGPLRRAANLGAPGERVWPLLAQAFLARARYSAAYSAIVEAELAGVEPGALSSLLQQLETALGPSFVAWRKAVENPLPASP